ncbi:hypothetical protein ACWGUP_10555 [Streptomyces diastaticus]|uniref:hypothetical protein n=1 Tax=Streptomyces rutgersensis TaxID=53451 RepID=UPI0013CC3B93|nr:hypothetical protein [Streptomyces rutgersensis]GFH64322.1 hypothetical protein Srut_08360 [Streptomyces rutgersensis]
MMPVISLEKVTTAAVSFPPVVVGELGYWERAVALFASSMPSRFRAGSFSREERDAWVVQGVERLGVDEVRRRARFANGYRLLSMSGLVTGEVQRRHEARFPQKRRLATAEQEAANSLCRLAPVGASRIGAEVDGPCPCRGTGSVELPDMDPDLSCSVDCPVHPRRTARTRFVCRVAAGQTGGAA